MAMDFKSRKIKFKAWNTETRLLMRLNSIDCNKGELFKKDHILLQFTGLLDKEGEEVYDMDVLLISATKYVVFWDGGWYYRALDTEERRPLLESDAGKMRRFSSYFELGAGC